MTLMDGLRQLSIWRETRGQDMVEYALLGGFIAVAAAATFPPLAAPISTIFSKVVSVTEAAP